jgi:hypothetical protein
MNDSIEFTPKEKYQISLYQQPDFLFKRSLNRSLQFLIPSVALIAYYFYSGDIVIGVLGYGILLFQAVQRLATLKKGLQTIASIHRKYEAQLQSKNEVT